MCLSWRCYCSAIIRARMKSSPNSGILVNKTPKNALETQRRLGVRASSPEGAAGGTGGGDVLRLTGQLSLINKYSGFSTLGLAFRCVRRVVVRSRRWSSRNRGERPRYSGLGLITPRSSQARAAAMRAPLSHNQEWRVKHLRCHVGVAFGRPEMSRAGNVYGCRYLASCDACERERERVVCDAAVKL